MSDLSRIYSAVYSGVPVFEMVVNDVAVMRRRTDSYMNATQILKVANIEKGKRTKILEKEVLIGEHEKVQGGYGKYQGTWIPFDKSKELADRYGVLGDLSPLFNFELDALGTEDGEDCSLLTKEQAIAERRKLNTENLQHTHPQPKAPQKYKQKAQHNLKLHALSPIGPAELSQPRKKAKVAALEEINEDTAAADERDRSILMSIFLSDKPEHIPDLLKNTQGKSGFNIDMVIDEQGHTALHWATALARAKTVELLVSRGANIACTSYTGETPLMRGVMVTNSYENNSFEKTFELLKESIQIVDNKKRSVFHHAALTAGIQGRTHAAVYYMKTLVKAISKENDDTESIINAQDSLGDTALNIAARLHCQPLVDILLKAGATQSAENNNGLQMRDYNDGDTYMEEASGSQRAYPTSSLYSKRPYAPSQRGKEIVATVQKIVDALDDEYGGQLTIKEQELQSVQESLDAVTQELETTRKGLEERQAQSQKLSEAQQKTKNIENALQIGWSRLESVMKQADKPMPSLHEIESMSESEDIDAMFDAPELVFSENATEEEKKQQLEAYVKDIQAKVKAYTANDQELLNEIKDLEDQFVEKEMQCKRLIAACCNLPIEKIDDLVEPLTLAIESDPPDLDLARVIGFMDKIRRQGAFTEPSSSITSLNIPDSPHISMSHDHDTIMDDVHNPVSPAYRDDSHTPNASRIVMNSPSYHDQPVAHNTAGTSYTKSSDKSAFSRLTESVEHKLDYPSNATTINATKSPESSSQLPPQLEKPESSTNKDVEMNY
ncbi:uncharacterized protein EV154DRAFT_442669 [Mucor mucedo]|uniref:uncharacterized protein n=1 Tax=Mucor mucedo TaxID=29922 RepID=UPI00221EF164|nr:uncharacterized protein EV154DRAFT_442669 [Mucor mucedo]KAI7891802.1 hypothetical protein EV154DRAFT_442669 [Mucor mucedo]